MLVLLAGVFGLSAVTRLAGLPGSRTALEGFGLPKRLTAPAGIALPLSERAIAILLLPSVRLLHQPLMFGNDRVVHGIFAAVMLVTQVRVRSP